MSRSTEEWVGKTDDSPVPRRVRMRVFERYGGVCYLSGRKISAADKWELEHIIAICNGGLHREDNMAPALVGPHKRKTVEDVKQMAKNNRVRKRHLGIKKPSKFACSRDSKFKKRIDGTVVLR